MCTYASYKRVKVLRRCTTLASAISNNAEFRLRAASLSGNVDTLV
jgi:hypothetical protein